jgi:hypothetical protein
MSTRAALHVDCEQHAALPGDLAEHKGMTVNSCLEETLLHTFEPCELPIRGGVVLLTHDPYDPHDPFASDPITRS